jgi:MoaA/NifB/PqqE/SkfB family radical SAM enzyme
MIKTSAIRSTSNSFLVIWDTGRRCNYDCSYCEATRHNTYSQHKSLDEFKNTFNFIESWLGTYNTKRKHPVDTSISFSGGEPTVNPHFWELVDHIKKQPTQYHLGLTTNGAWGKEYSKRVAENFGSVTISYHAEAEQNLKDRAIKNILALKDSSVNLKVNIMLHVDHWDETVAIYNQLTEQGISCSPRPIGDGNIVRKGWFIDSDGTNRRTSHEYSLEQQTWFWNQMGIAEVPKTVSEGNQLGRACCGGRCVEGKVEGEWQPVKLVDTRFEDWNCMVDWYFLYIDQETGEVYHHQTCKALYDKKTGSLGNLSNSQKMLDELKDRLSQPVIKSIICPNSRCGCGMCVPKASSLEDFKIIKESIINV